MDFAVQQIMLGKITNNNKQALDTLKKIKEIGYDGIELNQFMSQKSPFLVRLLTSLAGMPTGNGGGNDWVNLIKESNLKVVSYHIDLDSLEKDIDKAIKQASLFNTKYIVITGMYQYNYQSLECVKSLCNRLNTCGKALKERGFYLLYHNHNVELKRMENNQKAYDYLIDNLDENYCNFELDTYWMSEAGEDVYSLMERLGKRCVFWHINDRGNRNKGPFITPIIKSDCMELGQGNINLDKLFEIAYKNMTKAVILETHKNFINKSALDSIKLSYEYLKNKR